uniref:uncharacterized protein LOC120328407 isoform X2 n=1 Tax=Styela clava TaxID=7725 RepID=UPI00193A9382|nr:uncharacterized protein LOC120328407 isoform X2 [Styela clava]
MRSEPAVSEWYNYICISIISGIGNGKTILRKLTMAEDAHFTTVDSLTPSLEAIAKLSQEEQANQLKNLISNLRKEAHELTDENEVMKDVIFQLEKDIVRTDEGLMGMSYGSFVFEDKILNERLQRILDPDCNKHVQVGIIDSERFSSVETQTPGLAQVLLNYAEELKELRRLRDQNDVTMFPSKPEDQWEEKETPEEGYFNVT